MGTNSDLRMSTAQEARQLLEAAASSVASRRMPPEDVVRDAYVALEEFLKEKTTENRFPDAIRALRNRGVLTPTKRKFLRDYTDSGPKLSGQRTLDKLAHRQTRTHYGSWKRCPRRLSS